MAKFEAKVYRLKIEEHPNADALELAVVGDYRSIVRKGQFKTGDLGVYIPEAAVLPEWLIAELGLEGKLAGPDKNRVKAVKLRGVLSQGLILPLEDGKVTKPAGCHEMCEAYEDVVEGTDVTEFLGITKYEPPIPVHMAGEVWNAFGMTLSYDIENFKKFPDVFEDEEEVYMTEKLHGTWCCFGYHPDSDVPIVTSKGQSGKGLAFKFNDKNATNLYIKALADTTNEAGQTVLDRAKLIYGVSTPFYILGEIFGQGVQDLSYGTNKPQFRVFDIYIGQPGQGEYVSAECLAKTCSNLGVQQVPVIYAGVFSRKIMEKVTNGKETISGKEMNIREGVVIKPAQERTHPYLGRVILKSVSEDYLLRKGDATEYQ